MNESTVIEILDDVGGWVHPDELDYQLERRGEAINGQVMARLCRDGRVLVEPEGFTLADDEHFRLHPPTLPAPIRRHRRRRRNAVTTRTMILDVVREGDPEHEWIAAELTEATGRSWPSVQGALREIRREGELDFRWCVEPNPAAASKVKCLWRYWQPERAAVGVAA